MEDNGRGMDGGRGGGEGKEEGCWKKRRGTERRGDERKGCGGEVEGRGEREAVKLRGLRGFRLQ